MKPTWQEILAMLKPEPYPQEELEWGYRVPKGDYEVLLERLQNMTLEGQEVFTRSGMTSFLRMGDTVVGFYNADGDMVVGWCGLYLHAVSVTPGIKFVMKNWKDNPSVGVKDGDIFYFNDPLYGAAHLPDQFAIMPIFHDGELIAWSAAGTHQTEAGGIDPGGFCLNATSRYSEGIKLPPIKIGENFVIHDDMMEMMMHAVRTPRLVWADVRARVTTADRLRTRLKELCEEKGKETVKGVLRRVIKETEDAARKRLQDSNDGTFRAVLFRENAGDNPGMQRIYCTLRKEGDRLLFDFTGSSPENETPFHQFPHHLLSAISLSVFSYSFCDFPVCAGTLAPIDVIAPEGCMLNPHPDAACSVATPRVIDVQALANTLLSKLMFDSDYKDIAVQCNSGAAAALCVSGVNQHGLMVTDLLATTVHGEGQSALPHRDGMDAFGLGLAPPTAKTTNAEDDEEDRPLLRLYATHSINTCGFGKYRGGVGAEAAFIIHNVPYCGVVNACSSGSKAPLETGIFGGYPGAPCPTIHVTECNIIAMMEKGDPNIPSNKVELLTNRIKGKYTFKGNSFMPTLLKKGEMVVGTCIGGAGYGDVLERDPEEVMTDVRNGIIYEWTAKNVYHVAYDPDTFEVDHEQTKELRRKETESRLREGKPYDEFVREWEQKKPREDILGLYGSWPDAAKVREIIRI